MPGLRLFERKIVFKVYVKIVDIYNKKKGNNLWSMAISFFVQVFTTDKIVGK